MVLIKTFSCEEGSPLSDNYGICRLTEWNNRNIFQEKDYKELINWTVSSVAALYKLSHTGIRPLEQSVISRCASTGQENLGFLVEFGFIGSLPVKGAAVLLTNLLIWFSFPSKVVLFEFRIRWMAFYISFVFFEFKMFLKNDILVVFIFSFISFLTFLYATQADLKTFSHLLRTLVCFFDFEVRLYSRFFIQGTGEQVNFVVFKGA